MSCPDCGCKEKDYRKNGPHVGEYCTECGKWLQWISQALEDFVWPVGAKHRGKKIMQILKEDPSYLMWAAENMSAKNLRERAKQALEHIDWPKPPSEPLPPPPKSILPKKNVEPRQINMPLPGLPDDDEVPW